MMTLKELMATFPGDEACKQFLLERRWPDGVKCPRCGNSKVYKIPSRPWHWCCTICCKKPRQPYRFSLTVGTVFDNTKYPLKIWFEVLWQMLNSKKGVSALQIQRQIGCGAYKTAWYMCHRLRAAMSEPEFKQLMGIVEVGETYVGGKDRNKHWDKKSGGRGGLGSSKVGVIGAIARKGNVICQVIDSTDIRTLNKFVRKTVSDKVELIATDEHVGYSYLDVQGYKHETVNHGANQYVLRGNIHTQNIDSFWALLKRGVIGTYHKVSRKYLPLYLNEFAYRHNHRHDPDIFGGVISTCWQ